MKTKVFFTVSMVFGLCGMVRAGDFYVQQGVGNDANPGDAWGSGHAVATIQRGLDLAQANPGPDTVRVSAGVYAEHLVVKDDVVLMGSYPADGRGAPNRNTHPSIVDGSGTGLPISIGAVNHVAVSRFVVRNGWNQVNNIGGGISVVYANDVLLRYNLIENNASPGIGGGVGSVGTTRLVLMNNLIRGNHAPDGGGVALHDKVGAKVYWNAITDNSADGNGGGLLADQETALAMVGNLVRANQASNGGGVAWSGCKGLQASRNRILDNRAGFDGGGILHYGCQGVLRDNLLQNNTASNWGGGICIRSGAHPTLINNLITRNTANTGGGFSLYDHSSARALNNTIYHNTSSGIHVDTGTSLVARNTILWANTPAQISGAGVSSVVYSDVEGGWQGKGNLQADPQFRLAGLSSPPFDEDFHLTPSSPCRDSGSGWKAPLLDLEGNPRPQGSGVDMGAYEWMPEAP